MTSRLQAFGFIGLALAACGAEVETAPPASSAANESPNGSASPGPAKGTETADPAEEPAVPAPPAPPLVRVKNTSATAMWILVDAQSTPLELDVGEPPLQLNGYGAYWCGGPKDLHNDPMKRFAKIDPGALGDLYWRAISVTWNDECWSGKALAAGAYPTKACFYESDPTANASVPKKCEDVTLTIPASGEAVLEL